MVKIDHMVGVRWVEFHNERNRRRSCQEWLSAVDQQCARQRVPSRYDQHSSA